MKTICIILLSGLAMSNSALASTARTNCVGQEDIAFSCNSGKKTISLCVSPGQARTHYAEYRFSAHNALPFFLTALTKPLAAYSIAPQSSVQAPPARLSGSRMPDMCMKSAIQ